MPVEVRVVKTEVTLPKQLMDDATSDGWLAPSELDRIVQRLTHDGDGFTQRKKADFEYAFDCIPWEDPDNPDDPDDPFYVDCEPCKVPSDTFVRMEKLRKAHGLQQAYYAQIENEREEAFAELKEPGEYAVKLRSRIYRVTVTQEDPTSPELKKVCHRILHDNDAGW